MTVLLREFDRICRKYDIKYWCIGGTFIGAIRHKGWIPYDGDVDIAMLEYDYAKFKQHSNELPNHIWLQDIVSDKFYKVLYLNKLRDLYSHYVNYFPKGCHRGLQVDIFVYRKINNTLSMLCFSNDINEEFTYDEVFPLKEEYFEDIKVYIPNKYKEFSIRKFGNYPPHIFPINERKPHEGNMISDNPHPDDLIMYKNLYKSKSALSSSLAEVS